MSDRTSGTFLHSHKKKNAIVQAFNNNSGHSLTYIVTPLVASRKVSFQMSARLDPTYQHHILFVRSELLLPELSITHSA